MANTGGRLGFYIFILVMNLVFPILSYTFTTFESNYGDYDIALDDETLMIAGINLVGGESHNLTWKGEWVYYATENQTTRLKFSGPWYEPWPVNQGDGIAFERQDAIGLALDSWSSRNRLLVRGYMSGFQDQIISNASIITEWNSDYNWSRFRLIDGTNVFITPFSGVNITDAVFVSGTLNVTLAETFSESTTFNFWQFLGWYAGLMLGVSSWGLPPVFGWILKIFSALSLLALILLAKEMIRL